MRDVLYNGNESVYEPGAFQVLSLPLSVLIFDVLKGGSLQANLAFTSPPLVHTTGDH
jgi:hypothetical protein